MSEKLDLQGQCLCGEVQIKLTGVKAEVSACHCGMCRQWCGGPFMSLDVGDQLEIEGQDSVTIFNSSEWAERAFCQHCGANLYYRFKPQNAHFVLAGLFGDLADVELHHQIYVEEKPHYYNFAEQTPMLTAEQVMEMFQANNPQPSGLPTQDQQ